MKFLVVHKVPKLDVLNARDPDTVERLRRDDTDTYDAMLDAAITHRNSLAEACEALHEIGNVTVQSRDDFFGVPDDTDLVVAVGGDGTVLDVSHRVINEPLLGVNSDPKRSVGYFCACSSATLGAVGRRFQQGTAERFMLNRLTVTIDGKPHPFPCMNDLLITNQNPAMMSRYMIEAGRRTERQASSGLWISTPAGSTGGIRSAGGTVMPLEGALIQYLVREPYTASYGHYDLLRGVRHLREGLVIHSLMDGGRVFLDGPYLSLPFPIGTDLRITEGPPLCIVGLEPAVRER